VIFWEAVLILASVLVFRGAWLLLDRFLGYEETALISSLIIGIALSSASLYGLGRCVKGQEDDVCDEKDRTGTGG
jgi:hypothetical protein